MDPEQGGMMPLQAPKGLLNGLPKSGLHALWLASLPVFSGSPEGRPWVGWDQDGSAWDGKIYNPDGYLDLVRTRLQPGQYLKTHCPYHPTIEQGLFEAGVALVLIYRDPRDILVSQAHHVLSPDDMAGKRLHHPGKLGYKRLESFEAVMLACLEGLGPWPGLFPRWALFEPWLKVGWVLSIKYEDLICNGLDTISLLLRYLYGRTARAQGYTLTLLQADLEQAAEYAKGLLGHTEWSPTYRKGQPGEWQEVFTPKIRASFRAQGGDEVLIALGYEQDEQW